MTDDSRAETHEPAVAAKDGSSMGETRPGERMRRESGGASWCECDGLARGGAGRELELRLAAAAAAVEGSRPKEQHQGWRGGGALRRLRRRCAAAAGDALVVVGIWVGVSVGGSGRGGSTLCRCEL